MISSNDLKGKVWLLNFGVVVRGLQGRSSCPHSPRTIRGGAHLRHDYKDQRSEALAVEEWGNPYPVVAWMSRARRH